MITFLVACGGDDAESSGSAATAVQQACAAGDPKAPLEIQLVHRTVEGTMTSTNAMTQVPLIQPPQGGKVMLVSVRARNVQGCSINLTTSLHETDGSIVSLEQRPVFLEADDQGWLQPRSPLELSNYSNLPACPRSDLLRDIADQPYELRIQARDAAGRMASATVPVVPYCAEPALRDLCMCECAKSYKLGVTCAVTDAGI